MEYTVKVNEYGDKAWYKDDKVHREDGPAIEFANGNKFWYKDHKLHREDGPAVEFVDGTKYWYLNDVEVTEEEVMGKTIVLDGVKYRLVKI